MMLMFCVFVGWVWIDWERFKLCVGLAATDHLRYFGSTS